MHKVPDEQGSGAKYLPARRGKAMATLRKVDPFSDTKWDKIRRECVVDFSDEVTEEQIKQIEDLTKKEFESETWVTVEQES